MMVETLSVSKESEGFHTDPRVMVVEDEPRMRDLLAEAIERWGYDVVAARSGEEAVRLAQGETVDIALLDLNLPGMGGIETLRALRGQCPKLQGIILTGFGSLESAKQAIHLDVVEFLTKPSPLGEIEKALERAMRRLTPPPPIAAVFTEPPVCREETAEPSTLEELERKHIFAALKRTNGNRTAAAQELGISRRTLYYKLSEYERQGFGGQ